MKANKFIVWLLALLGFSGCDIIGANMYGPAPVEYGTPHAEFELKGKVTDEEGTPIQGIEVSARWANDAPGEISPVETDAKGEYVFNDPYWWPDTGNIEVTANDIDGDENGGDFTAETETITVKDSDYVGGSGSWYEGKLQKTVDFTLTLKSEDESE